MRALSGGVVTESLYNMLKGNTTPEKSADEATEDVLAEFARLGGAKG